MLVYTAGFTSRCIVTSAANPQHPQRDLFRLCSTIPSTQLGNHYSSRRLHLRYLISGRTTTTGGRQLLGPISLPTARGDGGAATLSYRVFGLACLYSLHRMHFLEPIRPLHSAGYIFSPNSDTGSNQIFVTFVLGH